MAAIHDLLSQVSDEALRARLEQEINKLSKSKKFGLVFEEHIPECTPLYDVEVKRGSTVAKKNGVINDVYEVSKIVEGVAFCVRKRTEEIESIAVDELTSVAQFGNPIFPTLQLIDYVENNPDSNLWHTLIEADNYHALQLLEYLYPQKVDCIYIDPPYNTGARDWKYNNDYVDSTDAYRHSKWLSMMEKRIKIAKKILNPKDSVLIVSIDEKEYLHLGCLLEEMFPEAEIQMVSSVINPKGSARAGRFSRVDEYIFFVFIGKCSVQPSSFDMLRENKKEKREVRWAGLMRNGEGSSRARIPSLFYPIFIDKETGRFHSVGEPLLPDANREEVQFPEGTIAMFPVSGSGQELQWRLYPPSFMNYLDKGYIKFGKRTADGKRSVTYLQSGMIEKINNDQIIVTGKNGEGALELKYVDSQGTKKPATVWNMVSHSASEHGSSFIKQILLGRKFSYPKSLYAVSDTLNFIVRDKPNALIVDFFSGSGTTLHAVNLLNEGDGGNRRCIMITNNEVSTSEAKELSEQGYFPGDIDWEKYGIAKYITWPRTKGSIQGVDINGKALRGKYQIIEKEMSDGFKSNCGFYKLVFLDKNEVALGHSFFELVPILWMKAGAVGKCPQLNGVNIPDMLILPANKYAILVNERKFLEFEEEVNQNQEIDTVYIVTDSEKGYREMISTLNAQNTYQLYRDYLDNFKINIGR